MATFCIRELDLFLLKRTLGNTLRALLLLNQIQNIGLFVHHDLTLVKLISVLVLDNMQSSLLIDLLVFSILIHLLDSITS